MNSPGQRVAPQGAETNAPGFDLLTGEQAHPIIVNHQDHAVALDDRAMSSEIKRHDRDLLKVAGRQAGSHLAQFQADQALVESRQFEAFNRLSAYVIHDLKNILAQLSLMGVIWDVGTARALIQALP